MACESASLDEMVRQLVITRCVMAGEGRGREAQRTEKRREG